MGENTNSTGAQDRLRLLIDRSASVRRVIPHCRASRWRIVTAGTVAKNTHGTCNDSGTAMPAQQLQQFLNHHEINYLIIQHSPAFTAQGNAEAAHVSGRYFAKTVTVSVDDCLALVAIPAMRRLDLPAFARSVGAQRVVLASESEFQNRFPSCELGAMPPFGNLFGMETYVSRDFAQAREIAFNAGSQSEVMLLAWQDYLQLVKPQVLDF